MPLFKKLTTFFEALSEKITLRRNLLRLLALTCAISVGMSQFFFLGFFFVSAARFRRALSYKSVEIIKKPVFCWLLILAISVASSVQPVKSFNEAIKSALYALLPFLIHDFILNFKTTKEQASEILQIIICLAAGQTFAALHTALSVASGLPLNIGLTGEITESGQLALVIPLVIGLVFSIRERTAIAYQRIFGSVLFLSIVLFGWAHSISPRLAYYIQILSLLMIGLSLYRLEVVRLFSRFDKGSMLDLRVIGISVLPILVSALLFNLKRGPWVGVFLSLSIVGLSLNKKLATRVIFLSILALVGLEPVRNRLLNFVADFTISGGRQKMWSLGLEIASRFPLGIGLRNADFMRTLDPYLPASHRHLHNNLLNILVETGYLGLIVYCWWMITLILLGFRWRARALSGIEGLQRRSACFAVFVGGALLAWQIAGIVEYNFGDAEIRMIAYLLMGVLLSLNTQLELMKGDPAEININASQGAELETEPIA